MPTLSFLPILFASFAGFMIGGLWYSPKLFGDVWCREVGLGPNHFDKGHRPRTYAFSMAFSFVSAVSFAIYVEPEPELFMALRSALFVSVGWVATSFGINYQFAGRTLKLLAIDAGYHVVQFLTYALILGLWH